MAIMKYPSPTSKYPGVGDNYMKRVKKYGTGEWAGYIYDPYIDKYRPDPKKQQQYYEESGLVDKQEKPSLFEQLYPTVASVGAYEIGKAAGPEIYDAGKGLLGLGEAKPTTTTTTTTTPTTTTTTPNPDVAAIDAAGLSANGQYVPPVTNPSTDPSVANGTTGTTGGGVTAGQVAQGVGGAIQAKGGYDQWQEGDEVGGGLNMAAGGANVGAAAGSSSAAAAGPYLSGAIGSYNAYNSLNGPGSDEHRSNEAYKDLVTAYGDFWTLGGVSLAKKAFSKETKEIDSVIDPIAENKYMQMFGNPYLYAAAKLMRGKDEDQMRRDAVRKMMKESGFVDENYNLSLANGLKFDIGQDGTKNLYNVDLSTPEAERDLKLVAPLAQILTGGDKKLGSDFSGYFTNAIRSGGDVLANAKEMYSKAGINSWDQARAVLNELKTAGKLSDQEVAVYDQGLANIFGNQPLEAPLAQLSTAPAIIPVQTPAASGLTGLMALGKPAEGTPEPVATPIARPVAGVPVAASPFSGLMALGRPTNPEEQTMVTPVARGGYR